jgi:hypothetical protein
MKRQNLELEMKLMRVAEAEYKRLVREIEKAKHLSDVEFVNQNARGK